MRQLYAAFAGIIHKTTLLLLFLLPLVSVMADEARHMIPIPLEERIREADIIVEGEVVSQRAFWDAAHENIYTANIIRVYKVFKGNVQAQELELITLGGTIGLTQHAVSPAVSLATGQQGVFFLEKELLLSRTPGNKPALTRAYAGPQGFVRYNLPQGTAADVFASYASAQDVYTRITAKTGQTYRVVLENKRLQQAPAPAQREQALQAAAITSFSPAVAGAGTRTILTINGSGFGNTRGNGFVEFRNADDGGQTFVRPQPRDYVSWSNNQIRVFIPSRGIDGGTAGSGEIRVTGSDGSSASSLTPLILEFAYSNVDARGRSFRPILINDDNLGGYTIQFAPSMQSRNAAQEGFRRAMNSWICNTGVNWRIGAPATVDRATADNRNIIRFAPASVVGQGVLARTVSRYEGCSNGRDTLYWLTEFDMEINSNIPWQYGPGALNGQFDFETVVLHELGHAHQLGHVILPGAIMHYVVAEDAVIRDLEAADIRGGDVVMAQSTGPNICQEPPMVAELNGDCNLAPEIFTFEASFQNGQVQVRWQVEGEQPIASYMVERSESGADWQDIGTVDARRGTGRQTYTFTDPAPLPEISFYRLRVVYTSGNVSFSPRVRVLNPAALRVLRVYPNPILPDRNSIQLLYLVQANTIMDIEVYNTAGTLVRDYEVAFTDVNMPIDLPLHGLAAGMYVLRWREGNNSGTVKLIKL